MCVCACITGPLKRDIPPLPWRRPCCSGFGPRRGVLTPEKTRRRNSAGRHAGAGRAFSRARGQCERVRPRSEEGNDRGCLGQVRGGAEGARAERNARESRAHRTSAFGVFSDSERAALVSARAGGSNVYYAWLRTASATGVAPLARGTAPLTSPTLSFPHRQDASSGVYAPI